MSKFDRPVYTKVSDKQGRTYKIAYSNLPSEAIDATGGKIVVLGGEPSIFVREGNSKHGEQLVFCLEHAVVKEVKDKSGVGKVLEMYLPKEFGLEFLFNAVKYLGAEKFGDAEDSQGRH